MAETIKQQQGGEYTSLCGYKGTRGLEVRHLTSTLTAATANPIAANNQRLWLIVENTSGSDMLVACGSDPSTGLTLYSGQPFQIDSVLPWCGVVCLYSAAGGTVSIAECSVL